MTTLSEKSNKKNSNILSTLDIVICAMVAALMFVGAQISLPIGPVPFTLQTFMLFTMMIALGGKRTSIGVGVYLLIGAIGAPVFAGFKGGIDSLLGPTGGFLIGFLVASLAFILLDFLLALLRKKLSTKKAKYIYYAILILICDVVMYVFGLAWFIKVYSAANGSEGIFMNALKWCLIPFIIPDLVKIVFAIIVGTTLKPILGKNK
ncbi:MAG: biotin transporter BioY [Saccharofermentans sp.]|nr:biotin transporter BioY [Saccharofermentans sp.]